MKCCVLIALIVDFYSLFALRAIEAANETLNATELLKRIDELEKRLLTVVNSSIMQMESSTVEAKLTEPDYGSAGAHLYIIGMLVMFSFIVFLLLF